MEEYDSNIAGEYEFLARVLPSTHLSLLPTIPPQYFCVVAKGLFERQKGLQAQRRRAQVLASVNARLVRDALIDLHRQGKLLVDAGQVVRELSSPLWELAINPPRILEDLIFLPQRLFSTA